tara:strand:- start:1275 stop:1556 length:282 start_codon:yes stop_codon:yes gene_type:complete
MDSTTAMTWGKIVLVFQAVVTLLLGIVFFLQLTGLDGQEIANLDIPLEEEALNDRAENAEEDFSNVSQKFEIAGYVLLVVSLIELLIISRFID